MPSSKQEVAMWLCDRDTMERLHEIDWEWLEEHREQLESGELYDMGFSIEL